MYNILFKGKFSPYGEIYNWLGTDEQLVEYQKLKEQETQDLKVLAVVENRNNFDIVVIEAQSMLLNENDIDVKVNKKVKYLWLGNPYGLVKKYDYKSNEINIVSPTRGVKYTIKEALNKGFKRANCYNTFSYRIEFMGQGSSDLDFWVCLDKFKTSEPQLNDSVSFIIRDLRVQYHITNSNKLEFGIWKSIDVNDPDIYNYTKEEKIRNMRFGINFSEIIFYTKDQSITYSWSVFKRLISKEDAQIIIKLVEKDLLNTFLDCSNKIEDLRSEVAKRNLDKNAETDEWILTR